MLADYRDNGPTALQAYEKKRAHSARNDKVSTKNEYCNIIMFISYNRTLKYIQILYIAYPRVSIARKSLQAINDLELTLSPFFSF